MCAKEQLLLLLVVDFKQQNVGLHFIVSLIELASYTAFTQNDSQNTTGKEAQAQAQVASNNCSVDFVSKT